MRSSRAARRSSLSLRARREPETRTPAIEARGAGESAGSYDALGVSRSRFASRAHRAVANKTQNERAATGRSTAQNGATRGAARRFAASLAFISGHASDACRETALVPGGLVAMDDLLVDHRVDDRDGYCVALLGIILLTGGDGVRDPADGGAHA